MKNKLLRTNLVLRTGPMLLLLLLCAQFSYAQSTRVTGVVKDAAGQTMPGVNVIIKGTSTGTVTDTDGRYSIDAPAGSALQFSFIGYNPEEITLNGQTTVDVMMVEDVSTLQEVVVVGYGTMKKSDLTGSVASVSQKDITQIASPDVVQSLQGRAAGVIVQANSGEPGSGAKIRIRGIGSISSSSSPLYVVDGFQTGDISFLNPSDISSIEVLKDASAAAIYGSRGANGVILITTKKGKGGALQVMVDAYAGVQQVSKTVDLLNAAEYATLRLEAYANDGQETNPDLVSNIGTKTELTRLHFVKDGGYKGTDWQDEIFQVAPMQNYSISLMGGTEKNRFSIAGTYFSQEGIIENSALEKVFVRMTNDYTLNKWLDGGYTLSFINDNKNGYTNDAYSGVLPVALRIDPITPAFDPTTGNWGRSDFSRDNNPARAVAEGENNKRFRKKYVANFYLQAKLLKSLSFKTQFGIDIDNAHNKAYYPKFFISNNENRDPSSLTEYRGEGTGWMWSNFFNYERTIGDHNITAMVGYERQLRQFNGFTATAFDVPPGADLRYISSAKNTLPTISSGQNASSLESYFGRVNYSFKGKYLFTGTLRYDGSSKFTEDYRWGLFPSFSLGWNAKEELFLQDLNVLSNLKLRAGWGQVGNQDVGDYLYVTTFSNNQLYTFAGQPVQGTAALSLSNPEIQWETSETTNVGLDASFFENRLSLTADYFVKKTRDLLLPVPIPAYAGTGRPTANVGTMENKGIELALSYRGEIAAFTYEVSGNITRVQNKVTALSGAEFLPGGSVGVAGATTRAKEGYEFPYFVGYRTDGIFNTQEELDAYVNAEGDVIQPLAKLGDVKYVDDNGDGAITEKDVTKIGSPFPDFTYGFSANLGFRNFDLRIFLLGSQGNDAYNALSLWHKGSVGSANATRDRLDRWTPDNINTDEPRMSLSDPNGNSKVSDRQIEDGSYLRVKNVQLGYTLPSALVSRIKLSSLRVYISADNLFTVTKYSGLDPEFGDLYGNATYYGVDQATYPSPRIFRAGVNIKL